MITNRNGTDLGPNAGGPKVPKHKRRCLFTEDGRRFYPTGQQTVDGRKMAGHMDEAGKGKVVWIGKRYLYAVPPEKRGF